MTTATAASASAVVVMPDYDESGAVRTTMSKADEEGRDNDPSDDRHAEGLCLGTLTIPLSRLPLEDAFIGNNAVVGGKEEEEGVLAL